MCPHSPEKQLNLGCIKRSVASRARELILPFCYKLVWSYVEYCIQKWSSQYRRDMVLLKHVQRRATKMIHGMKYLTYKDRLRAGAFQTGEEMATWRPEAPISKEGL